MNLVKTYIDKSNIEGIGLFAAEDIKKGTKVWELGPIDLVIKDIDFNDLETYLPKVTMDYLKRYSYLEDKQYIFCGDDAKYTNHSEDPNIDNDFAIKDIKIGEEITCDYRLLCGKDWSEEEFKVLKGYKPDGKS